MIEALLEHAVAELEPQRGGWMWSRREARPRPAGEQLRSVLGHPDHLMIVGTIDGVVVGYSTLSCSVLHDGALLATVEDIYVLPDARGVGVGEAMLDLGLGWADRRGCVAVDALALPGDRDTKNFFETFGLVARAIIVHRRLDRAE